MKKLISFLIIICLALVLGGNVSHAQTTATVSVQPATQNRPTNSTATVTVRVSSAVNLSGFEFRLNYNPQLLQITSASNVAVGAFPSSTGRTVAPLSPQIDNTGGSVTFGAFSFGSQSGPSGTGDLATITFNTSSSGTANLSLQNVVLTQADLNATIQPSITQNGTVTVTQITSPMPTSSPLSSPLASPVATPQASATPAPQSATFDVSLLFEGIDSVRSGEKLVSLWLKPAGGGAALPLLAKRFSNASSSNGIFTNTETVSVSNFSPGTYEVVVRGPRHLVKSFGNMPLTTGTNTLALEHTALLTADSNGDNTISQLDYNRLISSFRCNESSSTTPPGKDCSSFAADADYDGEVSIHDYSYLVVNYQKNGDVVPQ